MKIRVVAVSVVMAALSACGSSTSTTLPIPSSDPASPVATTSPTHDPLWITVKYRSDPVDIANQRFVFLNGGSSSVVDAAFYDAGNDYMIISLDGTAYHYCGMPSDTWSAFTAASSLGSFYSARIKGNFDCRSGYVPQY